MLSSARGAEHTHLEDAICGDAAGRNHQQPPLQPVIAEADAANSPGPKVLLSHGHY